MAEKKTSSPEPLDQRPNEDVATSDDSAADGASVKTAFESAAQEQRLTIAHEFLIFLKEEKKWWLLPILLVLGLVAVLAIFTSTGAAPFIYTLF